ncbi:MAG: DUF72 domain-containing protein [Hyphomicrobiaceae bacterium]
MKLYVGTSGYAYREWKGSFYPHDLPAKRMLQYYGERFRAVEINSTFYRMPTAKLLQAWASDVPDDFRFVLKASQRITHLQRLQNADEAVGYLLDVAGALEQRLGALLFQLPPNLKKDVRRLDTFLSLLPASRRVAFEFRHPSWFDDEVFGLLHAHRAALCIAETEGEGEVPVVATADWGYLRLRRPDYDEVALQAWVQRVQRQDWREAFVFFKHEEAGRGPQLAQRFSALAA